MTAYAQICQNQKKKGVELSYVARVYFGDATGRGPSFGELLSSCTNACCA
jgi:hypothetical protein